MNLVDTLKSKNIKVIEIPKWGTYLKAQWEDSFANHLNIDEKKEIYLFDNDGFCGYLWHLFSYKKKSCLVADKAINAFNSLTKTSCYIFYQHSDDALILERADGMSADDFIEELDIYVVDKDFTWTYVNTHETRYLGPYFSLRDEINK